MYNLKIIEELFSLLIDQLLHIIIIIWVSHYYNGNGLYFFEMLSNPKNQLFFIAIILVTKAISVIIEVIISKWPLTNENESDFIVDAGVSIGILERLLIFFYYCKSLGRSRSFNSCKI